MIIKCPVCQKEMDDIYEICPNCGCVVTKSNEPRKPESKKSGNNSKTMVISLIALAAVAVIAVVVIFGFIINKEPEETEVPAENPSSQSEIPEIPAEEIVIPNVLYMNINDAKVIISESGYDTVTETQENASFAEGTVISYSYDYEKKAVAIVISSGGSAPEGETLVPDIIGMTVEEAINVLSEAGLYFEKGSVDIADAEVEAGCIKEQYPKEGTAVSCGTRISVTVSAGKNFIMPDLRGKNIRIAEKLLEPYGIRIVKEVIFIDTDDYYPGMVCEQSVEAETETEAGSELVLTVCFPELSGISEQEAGKIIEAEGFEFITEKVNSDTVEKGTVIEAYAENGLIVIRVSKGEKIVIPESAPESSNSSESEAENESNTAEPEEKPESSSSSSDKPEPPSSSSSSSEKPEDDSSDSASSEADEESSSEEDPWKPIIDIP